MTIGQLPAKDKSITESSEVSGSSVSASPALKPRLLGDGKTKLAFCLIVLVAGLFVRFYQLGAVPEGLFWDEAYNGLDALRVIGGERPIFFEGNSGREPLFIYMQTLSVLFLGTTPFALRVVSALVGVATLVAEYLCFRRMFNRNTAIVATLGLSVSYWHVSESRIGFRAILVPLVASLIFYFLWRGLQASDAPRRTFPTKKAGWFMASGLFLGLSFYTYLSARAIPLILLAFWCWLFVFKRPFFRKQLDGMILMAVVAVIVATPLGIYFLQHPNSFMNRMTEVLDAAAKSGGSNPLGSILSAFADAVGAFLVKGDAEWRYNLSGRPAMDLLSSFALVVGLVVSIYRFRKPESVLLILWFAIMLMPSVISLENPHYLRAMGALPAAYAFVGVGTVWLGDRLSSFRLFNSKKRFAAVCGLVGLTWLWLGPYSTGNDYFNVWADNANTLERFQTGVFVAKKFLNTVPQSSRMLISSYTYPYPGIDFATEPLPNLVWFDGTSGLVIGQNATVKSDGPLTAIPGPVDSDTYYAFSGPPDRPLSILQQTYPEGRIVAEKQSRAGYTYFLSFFIPAGAKANPVPISHPFSAIFGQYLELIGFDALSGQFKGSHWSLNAGNNLDIAVYWRVLDRADRYDYRPFVHLVDGNGKGWGQSWAMGYPSGEWRKGDLAVSWFSIPVPPNTPPGRYFIKTGMYPLEDPKRVQIFDKSGNPVGDTIDLAQLKVAGTNIEPIVSGQPLATFEGKVSLLEAETGKDGQTTLSDLHFAPGDMMDLRLIWRAEAGMTEDYTVSLQVLDKDGKVMVQDDGQPTGGYLPTSFWDVGDVVADPRQLRLPEDLVPGEYSLSVSMYYLPTGKRLETSNRGDSLSLGMVTVESPLIRGFKG